MKLSVPLKFAAGAYVMLPSASTVTLPFAGPLTTTGVSDALSPSLSLASTAIATGVSSLVDAAVVAPPPARR